MLFSLFLFCISIRFWELYIIFSSFLNSIRARNAFNAIFFNWLFLLNMKFFKRGSIDGWMIYGLLLMSFSSILNPATRSLSSKLFSSYLFTATPWFQALISTSLLILFKKWSLVLLTKLSTYRIASKGYIIFFRS